MASAGSAVLTFRHRRAKEESPRAWWSRASCANLTKCSCRGRRGLTTVAMATESPHQLLRLLLVEQSAGQLEQRQAGSGALQHTPPHTAACLCTQQALPVPVRAPGSTLQLSHGCRDTRGLSRHGAGWGWQISHQQQSWRGRSGPGLQPGPLQASGHSASPAAPAPPPGWHGCCHGNTPACAAGKWPLPEATAAVA